MLLQGEPSGHLLTKLGLETWPAGGLAGSKFKYVKEFCGRDSLGNVGVKWVNVQASKLGQQNIPRGRPGYRFILVNSITNNKRQVEFVFSE